MSHSLKVGQSLVVKTLNRNYRNGFIEKYYDVTITKLGRKYFYVESKEFPTIFKNIKFSFEKMEDFDPNFSSSYKAYLDRQSIKDEILKNKLSKDISNFFGSLNGKNDFTLEQIKGVCTILNIEQDEK